MAQGDSASIESTNREKLELSGLDGQEMTKRIDQADPGYTAAAVSNNVSTHAFRVLLEILACGVLNSAVSAGVLTWRGRQEGGW
jgi:hypothetical protein